MFLLRERVLTIRSKYEVRAENGTSILYVERPTYPVRTLFAYFVALIVSLTAARRILGPFPEGSDVLLVLVGFPLVAFVTSTGQLAILQSNTSTIAVSRRNTGTISITANNTRTI